MTNKYNHITEDNIKLLVDQFYTKIRQNPQLSAIFERAIGENESDWSPHLGKMYDFWSSVMLKSGRYHGTPMQKHMALPPFDLSLFDKWLELFLQTANEIYTDDIAAQYYAKSSNIARSLKLGITH
jgi:hemoglobin